MPKGLTITPQVVSRFWAKVNKTDGCWLWTASTTRGYGQVAFRADGRFVMVYAHRLSWELSYGGIPAGLSVLHRCDTPRCVRPDHLFLGTQRDNLTDARQKGRLIDGVHRRKLSDADIFNILVSRHIKGSGNELARQYGVHKNTISRIRQRRVFERVPVVYVPVVGTLALKG